MKKVVVPFIVLVFLFVGILAVGAHAEPSWVRVLGMAVVDEDGAPFNIRSMSIGNGDVADAATLPLTNMYHDIRYLGFNTVMLHIDSAILESDSAPYTYLESGWNALDLHIATAQECGMRAILFMDTPPGGFQSWGGGHLLWTESEYQNRLAALWKAIAERYSENPTVLGYALLNEPCPLADDEEDALAQWQSLADKLVKAVRSVDERHILFVERIPFYTKTVGTITSLTDRDAIRHGFPRISDTNVMYQFQQFDPNYYTQQQFSYGQDVPFYTYPNDFVTELRGGQTDSFFTINNDQFDVSSAAWQTLKSEIVHVKDPAIMYVQPQISMWNLGETGEVWMDELYVNEYDQYGAFVRSVFYLNFSSPVNFSLYSHSGTCIYVATGGVNGGGTLYIRGVTDSATAALEPANIAVRQGYSYQMTITMGGGSLGYASQISPMLTVVSGKDPLYANKEYLAYKLDAMVDFMRKEKMPFFIGGISSSLDSFRNDHGGEVYIKDMLDLVMERSLAFNYFIYRNDYYGLYTLPGEVNAKLYKVFEEVLPRPW